MERRRAAGALLALAACILCTAAAPTAGNHTALDLYDGAPEGCYYNFQHYGEGDRIMTNEPCLNCTCHNRMLMCYLRVCPFTKPIGQDCTVEKRADQCCPIVTCPDVPVDLLTLTSTTSPAEYGATGVGKLDKYGCSMNGKYFPEGSKVPSTPNKPCEHCYCIRNMTTCVMQECTLHVDGCTPIYHKDVCCPVRYSCDHPEDEVLLLDDKTTTVRPTPGFLLTTTTNSPVTQFTQDCVHDDQIFADGAFIKTEKACEHCYCMKGDIVCVVQECGTPMENEGKNCTSLPPREGQCCPDTYICEGDELNTEYPIDLTTEFLIEELTTLTPPRRVGVEGSGYRKEPDNIPYEELHPTESPHEGSGDTYELGQTVDQNEEHTTEDNTKYIYSTVPSMENTDKVDFQEVSTVEPGFEMPSSAETNVPEDHVKVTTISDMEHEISQEVTAELDKIESSTSSLSSYDEKLETVELDKVESSTNKIPSYDHKLETTELDKVESSTSSIPSYDHKLDTTELDKVESSTSSLPSYDHKLDTTELDNVESSTSSIPSYDHKLETTELDKVESSTSSIPSYDHKLETAELDKVESSTSSIPSYDHKLETAEIDKVESSTSSIPSHDHKLETAEPDKVESSTSSIPSLDDKLETVQPEIQSNTEKDVGVLDDKITLTTITSALEEKEATTVKPYQEDVVSDSDTTQYNKYITTSTVASILEDEGITTETDREQQTIPTGNIEEHRYEPGLPTASTTSAPFLEEVEGIPTGSYGQHVVTDGITESDIYDSNKDKLETITTPAAEVSDNLIDVDKHKDVESTKLPELDRHELGYSTTQIPSLDEVQKTSTLFPVDLITDKSSEETHEGDKFVPTTHQTVLVEHEEAITEHFKESLATTEALEILDSQKLDTDTEKSQTENYDQVTDEKTFEVQADISTTASAPVIDQNKEEPTKASEEPITVSSETIGSDNVDVDIHATVPTSAPIYHDNVATTGNKDTETPQEQDNIAFTKPGITEDGERTTSQGLSYDTSTEKNIEQESYEPHKPSPTSVPITEEIEMATTEFIKDQDFVTNAPMDQDSLKPSDYIPSTSSTPFLEEIEKLTTEISQGHVVTDVIAEKEESKPSKEVTSTTETSLPVETADITTAEPDRGLNTNEITDAKESSESPIHEKTTEATYLKEDDITYSPEKTSDKDIQIADTATTVASSLPDDSTIKEDKIDATTEPSSRKEDKHHIENAEEPQLVTGIFQEIPQTTESYDEQETKSPSQTLIEEPHDIDKNVPSHEFTTEISESEVSTSEKEIKPDVEQPVELTTQITPTLPEHTTINVGENEIDEDNVLPPGRIPGEGDCLIDGITYRNESLVPSTNKCHSDCRCVSSIVKCQPIICSSPPEYMDNCQATFDSPDSCCPTYVCDQFRETLPPMPHIQITTTELPQQPSSIACRGDQCEIEEDKIQPAVSSELCADKDCGSETDEKTDLSSCGPHGCTETSSTPELCPDGKCTPTQEECVNDDCKHSPATTSSEAQCEGENCKDLPSHAPHIPECENGVCKDHKLTETIPVSLPCTEEGGCKGDEENIVPDCADESCRRKETLDTAAKPPSCLGADCEQQTPLQVPIETSTLGETPEIITQPPELHISDAVTTETALYQTIAPGKDEFATELNIYGTTVPIEITQQTIQASDFEPHKEPTTPETQEEPKLPEFVSTDQEQVSETHTESPKLDNENDILSTKIPDEYITESHPIDTDANLIPTEKQPIYETSKPDETEHTEPSQYVPGTEENTITIITDESIPTKPSTIVESGEILGTTSVPKVSETEKITTEKEQEHGISEVTEAQVTESQEHSTLADASVIEHEDHSHVPEFTVPKSEDITELSVVETAQEITTEYQSLPEYQSGTKSTTLTPTDLYITFESDEKVIESDIQKGDDEMYTQSHISATEPQPVSLESSTKDDTEIHLPAIPVTSDENAMPTEPSRPTSEIDLTAVDKITDVTEGSLTSSDTDKFQEPEKDHITGTELPEILVTESIDSTSEPSIKEHDAHTAHESHISLPGEESVTKVLEEMDKESTPRPTIDSNEPTEGIISEQEVTESLPSIPDKIEESSVSSGDVSTESSEFPAITDLDQITEKTHETEQEPTKTEKIETPSHDIEHEQDIEIEHVTMPEKATTLPEILSHKKEPSSESPIVSESDTEKLTDTADIDIIKQDTPSTDNILSTDKAESEGQSETPETLTAESQKPIKEDEILDTEITKDKEEEPMLTPQEISTENIYVSHLDKSTEQAESFTRQPELHETEVFIPVKTEPTIIPTPVETEQASDVPEITPETDKYETDINAEKVETSTEEDDSQFTAAQTHAPETQEPEINYTEKAPTVSSDSTTKTVEVLTTEQPHILMDTSTLAAPESDEVVTGQVPSSEEGEVPEKQVTTGISEIDVSKDDEVTTKTPEQYNTEEDLDTKIQDGITQQQDLITDIPEIQDSTTSSESSNAPELIPETLVTEPQDISQVSDEERVTEHQIPITEHEHPLVSEPDQEQELPVKPTESQLSTDAPKTPLVLTTESEIHDSQATTVATLSTDREEITLTSASPHVTEIEAVDVAEVPYKPMTFPESSSITSQESSTLMPHDDLSAHEGIPTLPTKPLPEEPVEATSHIPDSEKVEHEEKVTESPKPISNVDIITPFDESYTETPTGTIDTEVSTEPAVQVASESHEKDEHTELTSVPVYELSETTPYLIELQEHTHKTIQDVATSSPIEGESTTEELISGGIAHDHTIPETTEAILDKQTEAQEPVKHYDETSTPSEISEKTTEPTVLKDEEPLLTTQTLDIDIKKTTVYNYIDSTTPSPAVAEIEKEPSPELPVTDVQETTSEKSTQSDLSVEITTPEEINKLSTEKSTTVIVEELPTQATQPVSVDKITTPEEIPSELPAPLPDLSKPGPSDIHPTDDVPSPDEEPHFPPSVSSGYGGEPDYVEEDQAFGPGTCRYGGKVYVSAQQIPRDDPCDFCFCFRSDIICLQQSCPPPIHGCHEEPIQGFCCPRYECPVSMATTLNVTTTTTTTTTTLPPHFPTHSYKGAAQRRGCQIKGHTYKVGEVVRGSSGPCLHCTCGGDGQMKCDPKACTPEPMLRQMIAAAVSAKRRR